MNDDDSFSFEDAVPKVKGCYELNREDTHWLHLDVNENAIDSLETAAQFLVRDDNLKWKWFAFAIHHTLYSFCISALENGDYYNVIDRGQENLWLEMCNSTIIMKSNQVHFYIDKYKTSAYRIKWERVYSKPAKRNNAKQKKEKLISFWSALARVQDNYYWMRRLSGQKELILTDSDLRNIFWIAELVRNELTHFIPTHYSISKHELLKAVKSYLESIEFLIFESFSISFMNSKKSRQRVKTALDIINEHINNETVKMGNEDETN